MNGTSYSSSTASYSYGGTGMNDGGNQALRRRNLDEPSASAAKPHRKAPSSARVIQRLDFMFPKVDREYTIKTDKGGIASAIALTVIFMLTFAELGAWLQGNMETREHIRVDTSLGRRMKVNLNITFPGLACEDLHLDIMDVAGDSQLNAEAHMTKQRLDASTGKWLGGKKYAAANQVQIKERERQLILKQELPDDYCGSCYGAQLNETACCNTCNDVLEAYAVREWRSDTILQKSEQCIREGRDVKEPKRMTQGEGCNLAGSMTLNRVNGNFHIAMGEGVERNGHHIHTFVPDDTPNFNASHVIHHLSFGPDMNMGKRSKRGGETSLNGVTKITTQRVGTTGLFQYFIKIVPTLLKVAGQEEVETNRYFFTERFRPLMKDYIRDDDYDDDQVASVKAGATHRDRDRLHNHERNSILPGVFFIYEIFPFEVELSPTSVPLTHLLVRLMATVGGVLTIARVADNLIEIVTR